MRGCGWGYWGFFDTERGGEGETTLCGGGGSAQIR